LRTTLANVYEFHVQIRIKMLVIFSLKSSITPSTFQNVKAQDKQNNNVVICFSWV